MTMRAGLEPARHCRFKSGAYITLTRGAGRGASRATPDAAAVGDKFRP